MPKNEIEISHNLETQKAISRITHDYSLGIKNTEEERRKKRFAFNISVGDKRVSGIIQMFPMGLRITVNLPFWKSFFCSDSVVEEVKERIEKLLND